MPPDYGKNPFSMRWPTVGLGTMHWFLATGNSTFGPFVLESYLRGVTAEAPVTYLSTNLDLAGEPGLDDLRLNGQIQPSVVVTKGGEDVGLVGVSPPRLGFWSSPRNATSLADTRMLSFRPR